MQGVKTARKFLPIKASLLARLYEWIKDLFTHFGDVSGQYKRHWLFVTPSVTPQYN